MKPAAASTAKHFVMDIQLRSIEALFNTLDPSPLLERDLDTGLEDFILDWVADAPRGLDLHLVLHVRDLPEQGVDEAAIAASVRHFYGFMRARQGRRIRALLREGRGAAGVGLVFLLACTLFSQSLAAFGHGMITASLSEGLMIIGWVANWRPVSIFLYDWRPMHRLSRLYSRLANITLEIRPASNDRAAP